MHEEAQRELVDRILAHNELGTTDLAGFSARYPVGDYRDEERFRLELDRALRPSPVLLTHESCLASPGDFVTDEILGIPVVVLRAPSGDLRAYLNVCRHRGTKLVWEECGGDRTSFTCPAHGWHYDADGRLLKVPDKERSFPDVDMQARGLLPIRVEARHGFVWVTLDRSTNGGGVREFLGPLDPELASYDFGSYVSYRTERLEGRFNWKSGVEAFLETYHFRFLHPELRKYTFAPDTSLVDAFGLHVRLVAPKRSVESNREVEPEERRIRPHATIAYCLFPNTILFVEKRHISTLQLRPTAVDHCDVRVHHVVQEDTLRLRAYWDENIGKFMHAVDQDFASCESMQDGFGRIGSLADEAHEDVVFGRNEHGLQMFRAALERVLDGDGAR